MDVCLRQLDTIEALVVKGTLNPDSLNLNGIAYLILGFHIEPLDHGIPWVSSATAKIGKTFAVTGRVSRPNTTVNPLHALAVAHSSTHSRKNGRTSWTKISIRSIRFWMDIRKLMYSQNFLFTTAGISDLHMYTSKYGQMEV